MSNDMCTRRLTRELKAIQSNGLTDPRFYISLHDNNLLEWHYVIEGCKETPYENGFFWGKLVFPKEYPLKPPGVIMVRIFNPRIQKTDALNRSFMISNNISCSHYEW